MDIKVTPKQHKSTHGDAWIKLINHNLRGHAWQNQNHGNASPITKTQNFVNLYSKDRTKKIRGVRRQFKYNYDI